MNAMGQADASALSCVPPTDRPELRYHLLRAAGERFQSGVADLDQQQLAQVTRLALRTFDLECLVLGSAPARDLTIPPARLEAAVAELRARYADAAQFAADLERNGLDLETLRLALHRELIFDGVMQWVAARPVAVSELDEQLFYEVHPERFAVVERRRARHLLITVNDDFADNRRDVAWARIEQLGEQLRATADNPVAVFDALAREHSECPTALEGGCLGEVVPGQLYAALEAALFALESGAIGGPVESELGFHLVLCEHIQPGRRIGFAEAQPQIRRWLEDRARRSAQQAWLGELRQAAAVTVKEAA